MDYEAGIHNVLEGMLHDKNAKPTNLPITLLKTITNDFSDDLEIGMGGFAVVYKGLLGNGRIVAVKKLSNSINMDENKYNQEVRCLLRVNHTNIVRFLGYCADTQGKMSEYGGKYVMADVRHRLLCFEYLPKGSLDQYVSDACSGLKWRQRYHIIKGTCEGLNYLHQQRIVHRDLKPANILLDDDMMPKIADFGLSRCFEENQSKILTSKVVGSLGYLAPEFLDRVVSSKLDIYSLGVIIMELLTGHKGYTPVESVVESWRNILNTSPEEILLEQVRICAEIGIKCINPNPARRPCMLHIIEMLNQTESVDEFVEAGASSASIIQHQSTGSDKSMEEETIPAFQSSTTTTVPKNRNDSSLSSVVLDTSMSRNYRSPVLLGSTDSSKVILETMPRIKSILQGTSCTDFALLVRVNAPLEPPENSRICVDLVVVLDVAKYVKQFERMDSCKQAMIFVIDNLGPDDRLAIVTFNHYHAQRLTELNVMTDVNREKARSKVLELQADFGTDMGAALQEAATILRQRGAEEETGRVGRIIVLSCDSANKVPRQHVSYQFPVETFGWSQCHDPLAMHFIADCSSGTYSCVKNITEGFAQCIGGLTSICAIGVEINLETFHGTTISSIDSGAYQASINSDGRSGTIHLYDLYAGEQKNFTVWLSVQEGSTEQLMVASGCYRNPKMCKDATIQLDSSEVAIRRPTSNVPLDQIVCPEVAAELIRYRLLKGVTELVERPNLKGMQKLWSTIKDSEDGDAAPESNMIGVLRDIQDMQRALSSRATTSCDPKAFMLSWLTCQRLQRATSKVSPSSWLTSTPACSQAFQTTAMEDMLRKVDAKD